MYHTLCFAYHRDDSLVGWLWLGTTRMLVRLYVGYQGCNWVNTETRVPERMYQQCLV